MVTARETGTMTLRVNRPLVVRACRAAMLQQSDPYIKTCCTTCEPDDSFILLGNFKKIFGNPNAERKDQELIQELTKFLLKLIDARRTSNQNTKPFIPTTTHPHDSIKDHDGGITTTTSPATCISTSFEKDCNRDRIICRSDIAQLNFCEIFCEFRPTLKIDLN